MDNIGDSLSYLVDHVVLPPKLPQTEDEDIETKEWALLCHVHASFQAYRSDCGQESDVALEAVDRMLTRLISLQSPTAFDRVAFVAGLPDMQSGDYTYIHIGAQNAGILINRADNASFLVHAFELSPQNGDVISTKGRLLRDFPGRSVRIQAEAMLEPRFRRELAKTIELAHTERTEMVAPKTSKAGSEVLEARDTTHPGVVTEYLMNVLAAYGEVEPSDTIFKSTREEVLWDECRIPWRRSPVWLAIRVILQLCLCNKASEQEPHALYKSFMLYYVCKVASLALDSDLSSDILFALNAKIARRMRKIEHCVSDNLIKMAEECSLKIRDRLERRWSEVQRMESSPIETIELDTKDTLCLKESRPHIQIALERQISDPSPEHFHPDCSKRLKLDSAELPCYKESLTVFENALHLSDIESWITVRIADWTALAERSLIDCSRLGALLSAYASNAVSTYKDRPRELSNALLTIMEMWKALDEITLRLHPLLKDYSPEIPSTFLSPLLLPYAQQMERAQAIESYLEARHAQSNSRNAGVFEDPKPSSFGAQFYDSSSDLQRLMEEIEAAATQERESKKSEWQRKYHQYDELLNRASELQHDVYDNIYGRQHRNWCEKCRLERTARDLRIEVHEWPLPARKRLAELKVVIFELQPPEAYVAWRDATWYIVHELGHDKTERAKDIYAHLPNYAPLARHARLTHRRISLASTTKSFHQAHYAVEKFPVDVSKICVNNALRFRLAQEASFLSDQQTTASVEKKCLQQLPRGIYQKLQWSMDGVLHTSNQVLARQNECPKGLRLPEYHAFAALRAGEEIQWYNILRELGCCNLAFNEEPVVQLCLQTAWQFGTTSVRDNPKNVKTALAHRPFLDESFCITLATMLERKFREIEVSSSEINTLVLIVALASRTLSLCSFAGVRQKCFLLLKDIRDICLCWQRKLAQEASVEVDLASGERKRAQTAKAAVTALLTFDLEDIDLLFNSDEDVAAYVESLAVLQGNVPAETCHLSPLSQCLLLRVNKLACSLEGKLRNALNAFSTGVDRAIEHQWQGVSFTGVWTHLKGSARRWITNQTVVPNRDTRSVRVHFNLLTGELLADGRPLAKLPNRYTEDKQFELLFGKRVVRVGASTMVGMSYTMSRDVNGHQVHFALLEEQLIIRTTTTLGTFELLRPEIFQNDLPSGFVHGCVHWLDLAAETIYIRPREKAWEQSPDNWTLSLDDAPRLRLGSLRILDSSNTTKRRIADILASLDDESNINITLDGNGRIAAALPRLGLNFLVDGRGELHSQELDANVDRNQSAGCLVGLKSKLILRDRHGRRTVLVPFGKPQINQTEDGHVNVRIENTSYGPVKYFRYFLDTDLHRIRERADLCGVLFGSYLFAVTSFVLPDPFTGRTGTEEALWTLREQRIRSGAPLDIDTHRVLEWISELTPSRKYYPSHLQVMQRVKWITPISPLAQHEDFGLLCSEIVEHNGRFSMLHDSTRRILGTNYGSLDLQRRSKLRNLSYRNSYLADVTCSRSEDCTYRARDREGCSSRGQLVYNLSVLVKRWPSKIALPQDLGFVRSWASVSGYGTIFEYSTLSELFNITLSDEWGALYDRCRSSSKAEDQHYLAFALSAIVFGEPDHMAKLKVLLAFACCNTLKTEVAPGSGCFELQVGSEPNRERVHQELSNCRKPFHYRNIALMSSARRKEQDEKLALYKRKQEQQLSIAVDALMSQWPIETPLYPKGAFPLLNLDQAMTPVRSQFQKWHRNLVYLQHLGHVDDLLDSVRTQNADVLVFREVPPRRMTNISRRDNVVPNLQSLVSEYNALSLSASPIPLQFHRERTSNQRSQECVELERIIKSLNTHTPNSEYYNYLESSLFSFRSTPALCTPASLPASNDILEQHVEETRAHCKYVFEAITTAIDNCDHAYAGSGRNALKQAGLWPTVAPQTLLIMLSWKQRRLCPKWNVPLIQYAQAIALNQRAERMARFARLGDISSFYKEAENPGLKGWSAEDKPDWLLLEIENDFRIRELQAHVAQQQLATDGRNAVLQLNMGEGKSSVIVPMVAAACADGEQLMRVLVLRPLLSQTNELLTLRLGRLLQRRTYLMPFSRQTKIDQSVLNQMRGIWDECLAEAGVFITLSENVLSFRLLGTERASDDPTLAKELSETDIWLRTRCKDLLDESDEILHVRFQLVYTIMDQQAVDGAPDRWLVSQSVLALVAEYAASVANDAPESLTLSEKNGSYPLLRFSDKNACDSIISCVINHIFSKGTTAMSFKTLHPALRVAIKDFISNPNPHTSVADTVENAFRESSKMPVVLLLRGLFAHDVLRHVLTTKRWFVDYGLDPSRCMMAVPYRAKGMPSPSSEFGHPDVAILLTCLSYYYSGLTFEQLHQAFALLSKEPRADDEYLSWCEHRQDIPAHYNSFLSVNLDDIQLCNRLFPYLQHSVKAIDFFLDRIVFPREAKEFKKKLSASAWDIPALPEHRRTTGFSGTNDNRRLLPLSVEQEDLPKLNHTNAMALTTLLQKQNRGYVCMMDEGGKALHSTAILSLISQSQAQFNVLIDVGAQILDMTNHQVATAWLQEDIHARAVAYFDQDHVAQVVDREGRITPLIASPFHERMDGCIVYLDEAHARGIDLPLPHDYKAAILLGPRLQKDKLIQACMRMRRLDEGQTLTFFAPVEVHRDIQKICRKQTSDLIDSRDVVEWVLHQTQLISEMSRPLWFMHGLSYAQRLEVFDELTPLDGVDALSEEHLKRLVTAVAEPEARSLREMYQVEVRATDQTAKLKASRQVVAELLRRWRDMRPDDFCCRSVEEEQEREVANEVERERQIQRPPSFKAQEHHLHPHIRHFAIHGSVPNEIDDAIVLAFHLMRFTSAAEYLDNENNFPNVWASHDFSKTVHLQHSKDSDDFLRPVRWVLTSNRSDMMLVISPFEANAVLRFVEQSKTTTLHLYSPKISKRMASFAGLRFHSISKAAGDIGHSSLTLLVLNLFAGATYFDALSDYESACNFLGLLSGSAERDDMLVGLDGFVQPCSRQKLGWTGLCTFFNSPLPLLNRLLMIRGMITPKTHVGKLLAAQPVEPRDFSDASSLHLSFTTN